MIGERGIDRAHGAFLLGAVGRAADRADNLRLFLGSKKLYAAALRAAVDVYMETFMGKCASHRECSGSKLKFGITGGANFFHSRHGKILPFYAQTGTVFMGEILPPLPGKVNKTERRGKSYGMA